MWVASRAGERAKRERARNVWIRGRSCVSLRTSTVSSSLPTTVTLLSHHKLTSPPAALSLETPARWSRSPSSFHLSPSSLKSPSVLFSPSFPPYLLIILFPSSILLPHPPLPLPLSLWLSMSLDLFVGISLADVVHWEPLIVCGWERSKKEWSRLLQCRATKQHHGCCSSSSSSEQRAADAVCLHVRSHVRLVYTIKNWTLFTCEACAHLFCFFPRRW